MRRIELALLLLVAWTAAAAACGNETGSPSDGGPGDGSGEDASFEQEPSPLADATTLDAAEEELSVDSGKADAAVGASDDAAILVVTADASWQSVVSIQECAAAASLVVAPDETAVGYTIQLTAVGIDPNGESSDVILTWAATGSAGSLAATTGPSTTFACKTPGTATVTVQASLMEGGASCPDIGSLEATLTCEAP